MGCGGFCPFHCLTKIYRKKFTVTDHLNPDSVPVHPFVTDNPGESLLEKLKKFVYLIPVTVKILSRKNIQGEIPDSQLLSPYKGLFSPVGTHPVTI
jgi:hypothetical protein